MRRRSFLRTAGTFAVGAGGLSGLVSAQDGTVHEVGMYTEGGEYYYDPVGLYVDPGDTVRWINESGAHTTTAYTKGNPSASVRRIPADAESWDSGVLTEADATFEYTFEVEGTYEYYCVPHKTLGMVGRIVCGEPGGIGEEQAIPDPVKSGEVPPSSVIVEQGSLAYPYTPSSSTPVASPLTRSAGIFGTVGIAAVAFYHIVNSTGEAHPVGSPGWRTQNGGSREVEDDD